MLTFNVPLAIIAKRIFLNLFLGQVNRVTVQVSIRLLIGTVDIGVCVVVLDDISLAFNPGGTLQTRYSNHSSYLMVAPCR